MLKETVQPQKLRISFFERVNKVANKIGLEEGWHGTESNPTWQFLHFLWTRSEGYLQKEEAKRETEGGGKRVTRVKKLL